MPVGNPGNANDPRTGNHYGSVNYAYRIGTYEVTNLQYAAFLNAKATSDPLQLYYRYSDITRNGSDGSYSYTVDSGQGDRPVNLVTWYDAVRFANWLNNGQGSGDTETGAYTLLGGMPTPSNANSITRNVGAKWFLTSENEWYKAAYHKNDGVTGNYFEYPTSSDTLPTAEAPPGSSNSGNFFGAVQHSTDVGAYSESKSPYGAFDMGGNVQEFNEALIYGFSRGARGGTWGAGTAGLPNYLSSTYRSDQVPDVPGRNGGFRLATVAVVSGDFNGNGVVDAADYVVWRNGLGSVYTQADYETWRAHFSQTVGGGGGSEAGVQTAVPEPNTLLLAALALMPLGRSTCRLRNRHGRP